MGDIGRSRRDERVAIANEDDEYEIEELREGIKSSRASRFDLIANEFGFAARRKFSRQSIISGFKDLSSGQAIHPDNSFAVIGEESSFPLLPYAWRNVIGFSLFVTGVRAVVLAGFDF